MWRAGALVALLAIAACGRTSLVDALADEGDQDLGDISGGGGDGDSGPADEDVATVLFGQSSDTINSNLEYGLEVPSGLAICGGRFFVVDQYHHRVLAWDGFPARGQPSLVLGQPTMTTRTANYAGADARGLSFPDSIACNATTLVVSDALNHRVLVWQPLPTTNFEPASIVIGQQDFNSVTVSSPTASTLNQPRGVALVGNGLAVADSAYNRVLVWNTLPTTNGAPASFVLGQPNLTSSAANAGGGVTATSMNIPQGVATDGTRFFVADTFNNRVLVWNTIPTATTTPSFVLGQATFTTSTSPSATTDASLSLPSGFGFRSDNALVIADSGGSRMKVHASAITANNQSAEVIFGTTVYDGVGVPEYSAATLASPRTLLAVNDEVYVGDAQAHRVTIYPAAVLGGNGRDAIAVLGQPVLTSGAKRCPQNGVDGRALGIPMDVAMFGQQSFVADFVYHRVLVWNTPPAFAGASADFALGQASLGDYDPHEVQTTARSMLFPSAVVIAEDDLYVVDRDHHRILVWDGLLTAERPADRVLGQPTLQDIAVHSVMDGASFRQPTNVTTDGQKFAVADTSNNRVLIWNALPTDAADEADVVLGQSNFSDGFANAGGLGAQSLRSPRDMTFTPNGIAVADQGNDRVLIWNTLPTVNKQPADIVLGQTSLGVVEPRPTSASSTRSAVSVHYGAGLFYVSTEQRILVWRGVPTATNQPADYVIGQTSFTRGFANEGGVSASTLHGPFNVISVGTDVVIVDAENNRILRRRQPAP